MNTVAPARRAVAWLVLMCACAFVVVPAHGQPGPRSQTRTRLTVRTASGGRATLAVTVSSNIPGRLNGDIVFYDHAVEIGRAVLVPGDGGMRASMNVTLDIGRHPMTARYLGNDTYSGSASPMVMAARAK